MHTFDLKEGKNVGKTAQLGNGKRVWTVHAFSMNDEWKWGNITAGEYA